MKRDEAENKLKVIKKGKKKKMNELMKQITLNASDVLESNLVTINASDVLESNPVYCSFNHEPNTYEHQVLAPIYEHPVMEVKHGDIWNCRGDYITQWDRIMPSIDDVEVILGNNKEPRKVVVYFHDRSRETATVNGNDSFDLETGIAVCVTKKLLSDLSRGYGHQLYSKIINYGTKVYEKKCKMKLEKEREEERIKAKKEKSARKRAERKTKREAEEREKRIEEQAEAYYQAMMRMQNND